MTFSVFKYVPASILYKSTSGRYRPVSYPDGPITAHYRFIKSAYWGIAAVRISVWTECLHKRYKQIKDSDQTKRMRRQVRVFIMYVLVGKGRLGQCLNLFLWINR